MRVLMNVYIEGGGTRGGLDGRRKRQSSMKQEVKRIAMADKDQRDARDADLPARVRQIRFSDIPEIPEDQEMSPRLFATESAEGGLESGSNVLGATQGSLGEEQESQQKRADRHAKKRAELEKRHQDTEEERRKTKEALHAAQQREYTWIALC